MTDTFFLLHFTWILRVNRFLDGSLNSTILRRKSVWVSRLPWVRALWGDGGLTHTVRLPVVIIALLKAQSRVRRLQLNLHRSLQHKQPPERQWRIPETQTTTRALMTDPWDTNNHQNVNDGSLKHKQPPERQWRIPETQTTTRALMTDPWDTNNHQNVNDGSLRHKQPPER